MHKTVSCTLIHFIFKVKRWLKRFLLKPTYTECVLQAKISHLNLVLAVPPNLAESWVPPQEKKQCPRWEGREEKNGAVIKSYCHQHCRSA